MSSLPETKRAAKHPLAGSNMTGADMIVQVVADEGVDTVFGYSGGAILPTFDAIFRHNAARPKSEEVRLIVPATEQGATIGVAQSAGALARILGPLFAATLVTKHPTWPYLACAAIAALTGLIVLRRLRGGQSSP